MPVKYYIYSLFWFYSLPEAIPATMSPARIQELSFQNGTSTKLQLPSLPTVTATSVSPTPSPLEAPTKPNGFNDLISAINVILGPTSGLTTEGIDLDGLMKLMKEYQSNELDWGHLAMADTTRGYTRNLVDVGNGKSNLLILVWSPGKGSMIHDHADAHCLMRVLKGTLRESRFHLPEGYDSKSPTPPNLVKDTLYHTGEVTYMSDDLGLHRISNPGEDIAVSLHLYTPPNAARCGCNVFCERTGKKSHVEQNNYYSVMGVKGGKVEDLCQ